MHETNERLAAIFEEIASLLLYQGENPFKTQAYRRFAKTLRELPEPIEAYVRRGQLESLPGVGKAIAEKVTNYLQSGTFRLYERLQTEVSPGVRALLQSGLSPNAVRLLEQAFEIASPDDLKAALRSERLPLNRLPKRIRDEIARRMTDST